MSIELYREGLPRVDIKAGHIEGREGMLVGMVEAADSLAAILMLEDGTLSLASLTDFRIQFHYDTETDDWIDENKSQPDQEVA